MGPHPIPLPCALAFPPPSHRDATTPSPPRPVPAGPLIPWPKNASCSRIPPRASRASLPLRRWATTRCQLSLHPCTAPLSCSLQPHLKLSLLSFRPSLLQFVSIVSLLLNHGIQSSNTCVCVYLFFFCLCFSDRNELQLQVPVCNLVVITTAIPLLLLPWYSFLAVSEIFNHSDTCAVPSVCDAVGLLIVLKLCPVFTFLQQLMTKNCELCTHTLVLQGSPSRSSRQPRTTHVFADSRIALLCHALRICVAHAPTDDDDCFYYHSWRNNVVIAFGTLSSFLT